MVPSNTIPVTSPKRPFSAITTGNPRRTHPSQSTSLPKHKRVKLEQDSDSSENKPDSRGGNVSPNLAHGESRESSSDQSAAKWFASKNENVADLNEKAHEAESPFYLARQPSTLRPNNLRSHNAESFGRKAIDNTENDELRDVIDDLTVENKKLKAVIRNWHSRSSPTSANPDRVFEVRMHGLRAEKKRELEDILRRFATGLGSSPSQPSSPAPVAKSGSSPDDIPEPAKRLQQVSTHTDSGYASKSDSMRNSRSQGTTALALGEAGQLSKTKKDTAIEKFLLDIPDSLLPKQAIPASDNAKMHLVVQRLEQLFTGKRAAPGEHSLPLQQQQISRSAAKADRRGDRRLNRTSKLEGPREAHILPPDSKLNPDTMEAPGQRLGNQSTSDLSSTEATGMQNLESPGSPDQRPTRPLDLDINRAQVASDNIEYIRHLGLSSPQYRNNVPNKGQSWMYLNLLVSMAQLHTLNVTPAFVRKAIKQLSTKFELSKDGHKIRWTGGDTDVDPGFVHQGSPESVPQRASDDAGDDGGQRSGRSATSTLNNASVSNSDEKKPVASSNNTSRLMEVRTASSNPTNNNQTSTTQSKSNSTFDYKPVVFQGKRTILKAHESYLDSSSSYDDVSPESGALVRALSRSSLKSREDSYEGYVTFFSNSHFFTDLSGDKSPPLSRIHGPRGPRGVLGLVEERDPSDTLRDANACYFVTPLSSRLRSWPHDCPQMDMALSPIRSSGEHETQPIELDASGVGGVRPEDNFALDVQICRTRAKLEKGKSEGRVCHNPTPPYSYQVELCRKIDLQPSRLPPPSYVFFTTGSSSEAEAGYNYDDADSEDSSVAENSPAPAGFLWQWSSSNERQGEDDDEPESESSSSLGVLEAARARLPGAMNDTIGRVSGSLAATVGASWSAASNAPDNDAGRDMDGDSATSMSVEEEL